MAAEQESGSDGLSLRDPYQIVYCGFELARLGICGRGLKFANSLLF